MRDIIFGAFILFLNMEEMRLDHRDSNFHGFLYYQYKQVPVRMKIHSKGYLT